MKKLLVIVGPTGTGKTDLALGVAKKFSGELVSADSRQVYTGLDIGTGKLPVNSKLKIQSSKIARSYSMPSALRAEAEYSARLRPLRGLEKRKGKWVVDGVPIHLYDVITPDKTFSVAEFQQRAYEVIAEIHERNKLPILVGGTGLYIRAVAEGLKIPKVPPDKKLRGRLEAKLLPALVAELEKVDPEAAVGIDRENPRRIIRALEVYYQTGKPLSKLKGQFKVDFDCLKIGLRADRSYLYGRADNKVEEWFDQGFINEVKSLIAKGYDEYCPAMTSLGYRQVIMYLRKKLPLQVAKQKMKWEQHGYIRRQLTWFKKEPDINWFDISEPDYKIKVYKLVNDWNKKF